MVRPQYERHPAPLNYPIMLLCLPVAFWFCHQAAVIVEASKAATAAHADLKKTNSTHLCCLGTRTKIVKQYNSMWKEILFPLASVVSNFTRFCLRWDLSTKPFSPSNTRGLRICNLSHLPFYRCFHLSCRKLKTLVLFCNTSLMSAWIEITDRNTTLRVLMWMFIPFILGCSIHLK